MAERKKLTSKEVEDLTLQMAAASDYARAAGLNLAADIAEVRAAQADIETARRRFKRGDNAADADLPEAVARIRKERGRAARDIGERMRKSLNEVIGRGRDSDRPTGDRSFRIEGRVLRGSRGVPGLAVEAVASEFNATVAQAETESNGSYQLILPNVDVVREKLELDADVPVVLVVMVRKNREVVGRGRKTFKMAAGESKKLNIRIK